MPIVDKGALAALDAVNRDISKLKLKSLEDISEAEEKRIRKRILELKEIATKYRNKLGMP